MTYKDPVEASLSAVVAVPVRNERERIEACVDALVAQSDMPNGSFGVLLFLNNCDDGTEIAVRARSRRGSCQIRIVQVEYDEATAGWARRSAMELAADWLLAEGADDGIILTTDADSRVDTTWVADNIACITAGADAVAGRIMLDGDEAAVLPAALHTRGRLESRYEALLTEIGARLDPEPWNPWPCHWTASGASLAVRRAVYERAGGMPALAIGEDRAFVDRLRSINAVIRHAPEIVVTTSARLDSRAQGGAGDTMKHRCADPDALCDERLEPVRSALIRVAWRRRLRHLHAAGRLSDISGWSSKLGLSLEQAAAGAGHSSFSTAFASIEADSPRLAFSPLRPRALPLQIALALFVVWTLRVADRLRPTGPTARGERSAPANACRRANAARHWTPESAIRHGANDIHSSGTLS